MTDTPPTQPEANIPDPTTPPNDHPTDDPTSMVRYAEEAKDYDPETAHATQSRWLRGYERWRSNIAGWLEGRGAGQFSDMILLLPDMMALAIRLVGDPRTPMPVKVQLIITAVYVILPFDLIPEAVFGAVGLADDAIILSVILLNLLENAAKMDAKIFHDNWAGKGDVSKVLKSVSENRDDLMKRNVWGVVRDVLGFEGDDKAQNAEGTKPDESTSTAQTSNSTPS